MYIDKSFQKILDQHDIDSIRNSQDTTYVLDSDFKLRAYNQAWVDFAHENGGKELLTQFPLGSSILEAFPEVLLPFYRSAYEKSLKNRTMFEHDYECSSPDLYRYFHQTVYPLNKAAGLIVTHHKVEEMRHPGPTEEFNAKIVNGDGIITQCSHCRKIRVPTDHFTWLWVPALVRTPGKNTSHTLCPRCLDFYYPDEE